MKLRIQLSDVDRKRFDAPDWLDLDLDHVTFREAVELQRGIRIGRELVAFDSPSEWRRAFVGREVIGDDGEPVRMPVVDDEGEPVLDEDDKPQTVVKRVSDYGAVLVAVWLALPRAGIEVSLSDLADADPDRIRWTVDLDDQGGESGKDASAPVTTS